MNILMQNVFFYDILRHHTSFTSFLVIFISAIIQIMQCNKIINKMKFLVCKQFIHFYVSKARKY